MKYQLTLPLLFMCIFLAAQPKLQKDDPQARADFELLRLQDPKTKDIPRGIHQRERAFIDAQKPNFQSARTASWTNRGPYNVGGRTRALAVDVLDENIILAGGVSGGLWRSADQGGTWTKVTSSLALQSVSCIAQDPRTGQESTWYYGTGEITGNSARGTGAPYRGDGFFKSVDNGLTWTVLASTSTDLPQSFDQDFDYNYEVVVNPVNGNVIVANFGGIYQSTDGGISFSKILNKDDGTWTDVAVTSTGIIYASIASSGIWESDDNGASWTEITSEEAGFPRDGARRKEIAIAGSNENVVYVLGLDPSHSTEHLLWKYDRSDDFDVNGIGTWEDRSNQIPQIGGLTGNFNTQGGYDVLIKVKPDNEDFVVIGGTNLFASTDGFSTTSNTSWIGGYTATNQSYGLYTNHHPDQHSFVFLSGDRALSGNDGGVQLTNDVTDITTNGNQETVDWIWKNNGYLTSQSYAISIGPGDQIMSGFQDNSTWLTTSTSSNFIWEDVFSGDGAYSAFSSDGTTRWLSSQFANIRRREYSSASSSFHTFSIGFAPGAGYSTSLFITPFYLDPQDDNIFYLGGDFNLFINDQAMSGSSSVGWSSIQLGSAGVVSEIGVTNFNQVVVGTSSGDVIRVIDPAGDPVIENITGSNMPGGYVSGVAVNPYDQNEILVCFSNYSIPSIFHTSDGGTSWTDVSNNLEENSDGTGDGPSARAVAIIGNGDKYLVGTSAGIFSSDDLLVWIQEDPNGIGTVVSEHFASRIDGYIAAGTHGNGVVSTNFTVNNVLTSDLAVTSIPSPPSGVLATEEVTATVVNGGSSTITGFDISLFLDDQLIVTDMVTTSIVSLGSYEHTFSQSLDLSTVSNYSLKVEVSLSEDGNAGNNSLEKTVESIEALSSFPYVQSFEDGTHGWAASGIWERGTPSQSDLNGTTDGSQAWMTDLDSNYPNEHVAFLTSPFFSLSGISNPSASFDINYSIESGWDGVVFGYRTSESSEFTVLFDQSNSTNWYPSHANVFGHDAWQGTTNGSFVNATIDLSSLTSLPGVQFGFIFKSDQAEIDEGFAMDNFRIVSGENQAPTDLAIDSNEIMENLAVGSTVGTLSSTDADDSSHTYSVDAVNDAQSFSISGDQLKSAEVFDFEVKATYSITIVSEDPSGGQFSKPLTISIVDDPSDALGVGDMEKNGIKVFPNPVRNTLNLDMVNDYYGDVVVTIYSINAGKEIRSFSIEKNTGSLRRLFDLNTLGAGVYIISMQMGEKELVGKIIRE